MSPNDDEVFLCLSDALNRVKTIPALNGKVFDNFNKDTFIATIKSKSVPCVGVFYENMQRAVEQSKGNGLAVDLYVAVVLADSNTCKDTKGATDRRRDLGLLHSVRNAMKKGANPGARPWFFDSETPFSVEGVEYLMYYQRWGTRLILTG